MIWLLLHHILSIPRYSTLTLPEEDAANCLFVNGTLIHIDAVEASDSAKVQLVH